MILAIEARKEDIILNLFARFTFTEEDALLMSKKEELPFMLSDWGSQTSTLKLFIDKGLVDAFGQFKNTNPGNTMLDSAIRFKNEEMITFLRNLGVQTEKELLSDLK